MAEQPVERIATDPATDQPLPGTALCLSGGGYRAMVFHIGAIWRLYEAGLLRDLKRLSSVSGGSITAGVLALNWSKLSFDPSRIADDFVPLFVTPLRALAERTIDVGSILRGLFLPGRVSDKVCKAYEKHLFHGATLQNLPDTPRFVINATNIQSGALWRFMKPYMRDYRVGEIKSPTIPLARAVAASSAFPPVLSPCVLKLNEADFTPGSGLDLQRTPFTTKVFLSDGGVYDNLGLETVWKKYQTVLVSDAGGQMPPEEKPKSDWARHAFRVLNLIDNQVRALRKRQLIDSYIANDRTGAYWGIRTDIANYHLTDALDCPLANTLALADTPTRLARLDGNRQMRLINWGYAVCDAALRRHLDPHIPPPTKFPYPAIGV